MFFRVHFQGAKLLFFPSLSEACGFSFTLPLSFFLSLSLKRKKGDRVREQEGEKEFVFLTGILPEWLLHVWLHLKELLFMPSNIPSFAECQLDTFGIRLQKLAQPRPDRVAQGSMFALKPQLGDRHRAFQRARPISQEAYLSSSAALNLQIPT